MAELGGFEKPILHGLCTFGIAIRLIIDKIINPKNMIIDEVICRFVSHFFPGETF